jgi:hypothetical protein
MVTAEQQIGWHMYSSWQAEERASCARAIDMLSAVLFILSKPAGSEQSLCAW